MELEILLIVWNWIGNTFMKIEIERKQLYHYTEIIDTKRNYKSALTEEVGVEEKHSQSSSPNMLFKENVGIISSILLPKENLMWTIPNMISTEDDAFACITSPWCSLLDDEWRLVFVQKRGYLSLFLWKLNPRKCRYYVKLYILNKELAGKYFIFGGMLDSWGHFEVRDLEIENLLGKRKFWKENGFVVFYCEIEKEEPFTKSDVLRSKMDGTESLTEEQLGEKKINVPMAKGVDRLVQNLEMLLQQGQDSDIVLKVENREFSVHKNILSIRSPVFASMFHQDMLEKKTNAVDIPDCTSEAFEAFLRFMYTGSAAISANNVFDLYYAADKYQVYDLKEDCVEFMKQNLSVDTFCDVITLSFRHSEPELHKASTHFFCCNIKKIVKTVKWQKYIQDNPIQANELYIKAIEA